MSFPLNIRTEWFGSPGDVLEDMYLFQAFLWRHQLVSKSSRKYERSVTLEFYPVDGVVGDPETTIHVEVVIDDDFDIMPDEDVDNAVLVYRGSRKTREGTVYNFTLPRQQLYSFLVACLSLDSGELLLKEGRTPEERASIVGAIVDEFLLGK